jgi:hypothetical protein
VDTPQFRGKDDRPWSGLSSKKRFRQFSESRFQEVIHCQTQVNECKVLLSLVENYFRFAGDPGTTSADVLYSCRPTLVMSTSFLKPNEAKGAAEVTARPTFN